MEVDDKPGKNGTSLFLSAASSHLKPLSGYPRVTPIPERERTAPPMKSPATVLSDLDPDNVPREFKKEGAEWFAVWNPRNKKNLDVSLVHTLVHERSVRSASCS